MTSEHNALSFIKSTGIVVESGKPSHPKDSIINFDLSYDVIPMFLSETEEFCIWRYDTLFLFGDDLFLEKMFDVICCGK
jgi:hypothetical protein